MADCPVCGRKDQRLIEVAPGKEVCAGCIGKVLEKVQQELPQIIEDALAEAQTDFTMFVLSEMWFQHRDIFAPGQANVIVGLGGGG